MSTENLQKFLRQAQLPSEEVIRAAGSKAQFAELVVGRGAQQGFVFSEADVLQFIEATETPPEIELSDVQLDEVAGGKIQVMLNISPAKTMTELYQDWADLAATLKHVYR